MTHWDVIRLHEYLSSWNEPDARTKAAIAKLKEAMLRAIETIQFLVPSKD